MDLLASVPPSAQNHPGLLLNLCYHLETICLEKMTAFEFKLVIFLASPTRQCYPSDERLGWG